MGRESGASLDVLGRLADAPVRHQRYDDLPDRVQLIAQPDDLPVGKPGGLGTEQAAAFGYGEARTLASHALRLRLCREHFRQMPGLPELLKLPRALVVWNIRERDGALGRERQGQFVEYGRPDGFTPERLPDGSGIRSAVSL